MTKLRVIYGEDHIYIEDEKGKELVYWDKQEWIDDPDVVFSIANAVGLANSSPELLIEKLQTYKKH